MATPRKAPTRSNPPQASRPLTYNRNDPNHVTVDPKWLGKVFGYTVLAAFVCAYLAMCVLFRVGSWQWVLHPTHSASRGTGLSGELVHFGPDAGGTPELTGEWIPAASTSTATVLYLRPGDGQLDFADAPLLQMLHDDRLNVLAFDYRGYGRSALKPHPTEEHMQQDAEAAWNYVTGLRGIPADHVLIYGAGVGASLATNLAAAHPQTAALVLRNATAAVLDTIRGQKRARMFPVRLLLQDRFELTKLSQIATPKLLWDIGPATDTTEAQARVAAYRSAEDPKMIVTLPTDDPAQERASLRRFLDDRVGLLPPSELVPAAGSSANAQ